jgi:segregation and condensation protein B
MTDADFQPANDAAAIEPAAIEPVAETPVTDEDRNERLKLLEAILFAESEPVSFAALAEQVGNSADLPSLMADLEARYADRGIRVVETGGLWSFRTAPELGDRLKVTKQPRRKLPRAAAEVLAIIAYHQPVTRGEIESIRGVETSRGTLDLLLEIGWIRPGKRREVPGRPLTWKTTPEFLSHFNLATLKELPGLEDLKAAGLLDAKPVLNKISLDDEKPPVEADPDDDTYAVWLAPDDANAGEEGA